jgi:hypothetical protein
MIRVLTLRTTREEDQGTAEGWQKVDRALAAATPGLLHVEVNRVSSAPVAGHDAYGLLVKLTFVDRASFESAQKTEAGRDLLGFTKGLVTMLVIERTDSWAEPDPIPAPTYFGG